MKNHPGEPSLLWSPMSSSQKQQPNSPGFPEATPIPGTSTSAVSPSSYIMVTPFHFLCLVPTVYHQDTKWCRLQGTILHPAHAAVIPRDRICTRRQGPLYTETLTRACSKQPRKSNQQTASTTASPQWPSVINTCQAV